MPMTVSRDGLRKFGRKVTGKVNFFGRFTKRYYNPAIRLAAFREAILSSSSTLQYTTSK